MLPFPFERPSVERIEQELESLAGLSSGFSEPEALEALHDVLGLGVVERRAGPDGHLLDKVAALRHVLTIVTDRISDKRTREMAKLHFFLDQDEQLQASTISKRRDIAERRYKLGHDGFRHGPEQWVRGIVAGELLCYELDGATPFPLTPDV